MESSPVQQDGGGDGVGYWEEDDSERSKIFESENIPDSSNNRLFQLMEQNRREEEELEAAIKAAGKGMDFFYIIKKFTFVPETKSEVHFIKFFFLIDKFYKIIELVLF